MLAQKTRVPCTGCRLRTAMMTGRLLLAAPCHSSIGRSDNHHHVLRQRHHLHLPTSPRPRRRPWALLNGTLSCGERRRPHDGTERHARTPVGRRAAARGGSADTQISRAKGTETMVDACFSSGGELSRGKVNDRDAAALRQAAEASAKYSQERTPNTVHPEGERYFSYHPPLGSFRCIRSGSCG